MACASALVALLAPWGPLARLVGLDAGVARAQDASGEGRSAPEAVNSASRDASSASDEAGSASEHVDVGDAGEAPSDARGPAATTSTEAGPVAPRTRIAVVLLPRGEASSDIADSLTELVIAALAARGPVEIVGKEELQAALGRDDEGTLACIESNACLGRMGRELRVTEFVAGTIHVPSGAPGHFDFDLYRLDVSNGRVRARVARTIDGGLRALLAALTASVDELYVEHVEPGSLVLTVTPPHAEVRLDGQALDDDAPGLFRRELIAPGTHALSVRAPHHVALERSVQIEAGTTAMLSLELDTYERELELSPWTWALAGASLVTGGVAIGLGVASQAGPSAPLDMRQSADFYDARTLEAIGADVLFAVAGSALVGAVVSFVFDLENEPLAVVRALREGAVLRW